SQCGRTGGQQDGKKDQRRFGRSLLRPVHEEGDRQQGQRRRIQGQEQDLCVGGGAGVRVERLQGVHGAQPDGRGRVVQPQTVGREIHGDQPQRRVAGGHFR